MCLFGYHNAALVEHSGSESVGHIKTEAFPNPSAKELPDAVLSVLNLRGFGVKR